MENYTEKDVKTALKLVAIGTAEIVTKETFKTMLDTLPESLKGHVLLNVKAALKTIKLRDLGLEGVLEDLIKVTNDEDKACSMMSKIIDSVM